jgi:hypothetical protein
MSRAPKIKMVAARLLPAKAARRGFPAWIDASERGVAFSCTVVMPRVRDGLVLRMVSRSNLSATARTPAHGSGAR